MAQTLESASAVGTVEAVIISGPRRGEIIQLPEESVPEFSEEDVKLLNAALDQVEAALDRFETTVDAAIERFKQPPKES